MYIHNRNILIDLKEQLSGYQWGQGMEEGQIRCMGLTNTNHYI